MTTDELRALIPNWDQGLIAPKIKTLDVLYIEKQNEKEAKLTFTSPHSRLDGWDPDKRPYRSAQPGEISVRVLGVPHEGDKIVLGTIEPLTFEFKCKMQWLVSRLHIWERSLDGWEDDPFDLGRIGVYPKADEARS